MKIKVILIMLCLLICAAGTTAGDQHGVFDPRSVENFIDQVITKGMTEQHVPGAVFTLVKDGEVLLNKGYGFANLEKSTPVDSERSSFFVGSVTKMFTWTALMQLVEKGELSLEDDIQKYLSDIDLPKSYSEPVKIKNLLTHSTGYVDMIVDSAAVDKNRYIPLEEFIATHLPAQRARPGEIHDYTNVMTAAAGLIIERVSGLPFERYLEQNIFNPLDMRYTVYPLPDTILSPEISQFGAVGYEYDHETEKYDSLPVEYWFTGPASMLKTSGGDMARFMIAHLNYGWGFQENYWTDVRHIGHYGDYRGFHSVFMLFPELDMGFFFSVNSESGVKLVGDVHEKLLQYFFPQDPAKPRPQPMAGYKDRVKRYEGFYSMFRFNTKDILRFSSLMISWKADANEDGTLSLTFPQGLSGYTCRYVEVEPLLFELIDVEGDVDIRSLARFMKAAEDQKGRVRFLIPVVKFHSIALERNRWYRSTGLMLPLVIFIMIVFITATAGFPLRWIIKKTGHKNTGPPSLLKTARYTAWAASASGLAFFMIFFMTLISKGPYSITYGMNYLGVGWSFFLPFLTAALLAVLGLLTVFAWVKGAFKLFGRLYYTIIVLACSGYLYFLGIYNLIGFRF